MSAEEVQIIPLAHHIQRPPEEQSTVESSTIWVSAAGSILMMKKLCLSTRSAFAQRMLNMCSGWGLGTAAFIGGTLTSHTARSSVMSQVLSEESGPQ
ncbi:hypothetical protein NQZ68_028842 [Dissostichus eleginoides]|nr:hypothetical protein NQZ68_028842 [Dissostichus eleginoides]